MIIRQFCARHGRTVLSSSRAASRCTYATSISDRKLTPSTGDRAPQQTIPGHPDEPSSIIDQSPLAPTGRSRILEKEVDSSRSTAEALQAELSAHISAATGGITSDPQVISWHDRPSLPEIGFDNFSAYAKHRTNTKQQNRSGTHLIQTYNPATMLKDPPSADEVTLPMLLANQTHLGHHTSLWNPANSAYIFGKREGIHIISLDITYAYLRRAAKVISEVARRGGIMLFIGTRPGQRDIVVTAAKRAGGYHIYDRWIPGSLTNGQQILGHCAVKAVDLRDNEIEAYSDSLRGSGNVFLRPDLVVMLNPLENEVCLHECGIHTIPTIGVIDTDANPSWVTYPIPANDDSHRSIGLIAGVLSKASEEGQRLRMEEAKRGKTTYSTGKAVKYLGDVEVLSGMDVSGDERGGKQEKDDEDGGRRRAAA